MPDDGHFIEIDQKNHAEDKEANGRALKFLQDTLPHVRSDRSAFDTDNRTLYNLWDTKRDIHYYRGRAALYIPSAHKAIERACGKQLARLFPSGDDYFDVGTIPPGEEEQEEVAQDLESAKALMFYDLKRCVKLRQWIMPFLRQFNILGTSPSALDYLTQEEVEAMSSKRRYRLVRQKDTPGEPLAGKSVPRIDEIGPTGRPVDLFTWYVSPSTANNVQDAQVVFEDQLLSEATLLKRRKAGRYHFEDGDLKAHAGKAPEYSIWAGMSRMSERGAQTTDPENTLYVVTSAYANWLPEDKEDAEPIPCRLTVVNDALVIEARQNPWWHQLPPYQVARLFQYVDEFYGRGLVYFSRTLQYLINDIANQTLDGMSYTLNPIACIDPDFPDPDLLQYRPGAKWPIDKEKVLFLQIADHSAAGFAAIRQLYEFSQDVAGASTGGMALPTLGIAQGAKTATGQSLLVAQGDIDVNAIVSTSLEEQWLEPKLQMIDSMEQQFLPIQGERVLRALGPKAMPLLRDGMRVRREMMLGTRVYSWKGSVLTEQREKFQKHGADMLKILAQLKQANDPDYRINLAPFVKDLYRSYAFPNADEIIQLVEPGEGFDPELEHAVMAAGWPVKPRWGEPYIPHLAKHNAMLPQARAQGWGKRLETHMHETLAMLQKAGPGAMQGQAMPALGPGGPGQPGVVPPGAVPPPGNGGVPVPPEVAAAGGRFGTAVPPPGGAIPQPAWPGGA